MTDADPRLLRQVTAEEQQDALLKAMLVAPVRALQLLRRVPLALKAAGWPCDEVSVHVVCAYVGAYKIGAQAQRFRVPDSLLVHPAWVELVMRVGSGAPMAGQVVDHFAAELYPLLHPPE